jgi:hypothetical protein
VHRGEKSLVCYRVTKLTIQTNIRDIDCCICIQLDANVFNYVELWPWVGNANLSPLSSNQAKKLDWIWGKFITEISVFQRVLADGSRHWWYSQPSALPFHQIRLLFPSCPFFLSSWNQASWKVLPVKRTYWKRWANADVCTARCWMNDHFAASTRADGRSLPKNECSLTRLIAKRKPSTHDASHELLLQPTT